MNTKIWHDNRSEYTSRSRYDATMDEHGRSMISKKMKTNDVLGPYRNEGYYKEKGQFFKEESPPPYG